MIKGDYCVTVTEPIDYLGVNLDRQQFCFSIGPLNHEPH